MSAPQSLRLPEEEEKLNEELRNSNLEIQE
jgi:hypothetical protein